MRFLALLHPFLLLALLTFGAGIGVFFLEQHGFSYDDTGGGAVVFLLWLVLLWPAQAVMVLLFPLGVIAAQIGYVCAVIGLVVLYVWLDRRFTAWATTRIGSAA